MIKDKKIRKSDISKKSRIKVQLVTTFVFGTLLANSLLAVILFFFTRYRMRTIRNNFGEDFAPSVQMMLLHSILIAVLVLVLLGILLYSSVYREIMSPLQQLATAANKIAEGNLDFTVETPGTQDEISVLCESFEEMRKRLKEDAEEKLRIENENRQFISNITHDLKTPMTSIKGYAEGLLDGIADTPDKQEKYIRTIYSKASEMDRLISELTYYSGIRQNRIPYDFAKISIGDYFQDCVEEISVDLEEKNFTIELENQLTTPAIVIADPIQLRKVVNNIISNSVKYSDKPKGQIRIRIKDAEDFVLVELEDNGKGIAAKDLPNIFDRFFRADTARNSSTGGSGIGLSIVRKIIEDHGGRIWATSTQGSGTTIHIELRKCLLDQNSMGA